MEHKLLQPFLQAGLLEIGDSDERLANIQKSIEDLQKKLGEDYSLLPSYMLVALDPDISDDEQVLIDTEAIIVVHWKALRAKFSERPRTLLRVVILNSLYELGIGDAYAARVISLTARNFYPYAKLGREKELIKRIISELGDLAEEDATEEWTLVEEAPGIKLKPLKITNSKINSISIDQSIIEKKFKKGASNPNGHNAYQYPDQWATYFSTNASEGIANALENGLQEFTKSLSPSNIEAPINNFFSDFKKSLDAVLKSSFNSIVAVERRSKLLWWKETLYSPSVKDSYRSLDKSVQPIVTAVDLYRQLPDITPVSVEYLLQDTLLLLNKEADEKISFSEYLTSITDQEKQKLLGGYFRDDAHTDRRITFTDFLSLLLHNRVSLAEFHQRTGIKETDKVSLNDVAVMLLRDLLTQRLISK